MTYLRGSGNGRRCTEPEFLDVDVIGTNIRVFSSLLFKVTSKGGLKLACNVNILYGNLNLKSENSPDYTQNPNEIVRS
jgi:hypothetical protein